MNTGDSQDTLARQLAPIIPPPPPDWSAVICIVGSLIAIGLLFLLMRWLQARARRYQGPARGNRELQALQQAWQTGEHSPRRSAYHLAALLRRHFGLARLTMVAPESLREHSEEWQGLVRLLEDIRYQPADKRPALDAACFRQIQHWLDRSEP